MKITVNLSFNVIDDGLLEKALLVLDDSEVFGEGEDSSQNDLGEKVDLIVSHLDVIALAFGHPVGWLDVGLERIN